MSDYQQLDVQPLGFSTRAITKNLWPPQPRYNTPTSPEKVEEEKKLQTICTKMGGKYRTIKTDWNQADMLNMLYYADPQMKRCVFEPDPGNHERRCDPGAGHDLYGLFGGQIKWTWKSPSWSSDGYCVSGL